MEMKDRTEKERRRQTGQEVSEDEGVKRRHAARQGRASHSGEERR